MLAHGTFRAAATMLGVVLFTVGCAAGPDTMAGDTAANTLGDDSDGDRDDDRDTDDGDDDPSGGSDGGDGGPDAGTTSDGSEATGDDGEPGDTDGEDDTAAGRPEVPVLHQAAYNPDTETYEFGFDSFETVEIHDAPDDVDWTRWAMAHDGSTYLLYAMRAGGDDTVYEFRYNPDTEAYEHAGVSISIQGTPADADMSSIAVMHDGSIARLYALSSSAPVRVHQFGYDAGSGRFAYGHESLEVIDVMGTPAGVDWGGWAMLHDGGDYRLYAYASGAHDAIVQHAFDGDTDDYVHALSSLSPLDVGAIPAASDGSDFAMLHDGGNFRLYTLEVP